LRGPMAALARLPGVLNQARHQGVDLRLEVRDSQRALGEEAGQGLAVGGGEQLREAGQGIGPALGPGLGHVVGQVADVDAEHVAVAAGQGVGQGRQPVAGAGWGVAELNGLREPGWSTPESGNVGAWIALRSIQAPGLAEPSSGLSREIKPRRALSEVARLHSKASDSWPEGLDFASFAAILPARGPIWSPGAATFLPARPRSRSWAEKGNAGFHFFVIFGPTYTTYTAVTAVTGQEM